MKLKSTCELDYRLEAGTRPELFHHETGPSDRSDEVFTKITTILLLDA